MEVHGRVLLYTSTGLVITMAPQERQARTFVGSWLGTVETLEGDATRAQLRIYANGSATWRPLDGGSGVLGEWDRDGRIFTFTWPGADSTEDSTRWVGLYDAEGNAIQFPETGEGTLGMRRLGSMVTGICLGIEFEVPRG